MALLRERGLVDESKENLRSSSCSNGEIKGTGSLIVASDSEKGNNPSFELRTSKGIMTIELFEDDAHRSRKQFHLPY